QLFGHRPRSRRELTAEHWLNFWAQYVDNLERRLARLRTGELPFEAMPGRSLEDYLLAQGEFAASLRRLIASIRDVLQPVRHLETVLAARDEPHALSAFARACAGLLEALGIGEWLAPDPAVPALESWKD